MGRDMGMPIIKFEIDGLKHTLVRCLSERAIEMDQYIQQEVESFCSDENLERVIKAYAKNALDTAIREEVDHFFRYGEGRIAVAEAVRENILKKETYTLLDEVKKEEVEKK